MGYIIDEPLHSGVDCTASNQLYTRILILDNFSLDCLLLAFSFLSDTYIVTRDVSSDLPFCCIKIMDL